MVSLEETEFVESFSSEITIPETIPKWLWGGDIKFSENHPSVRFKVIILSLFFFTFNLN